MQHIFPVETPFHHNFNFTWNIQNKVIMRAVLALSIPILSIVAICSHYLNVPVPPEMSEPWLYRAAMGVNRAAADAIKMYCYIAGDDGARKHAQFQIGVMETLKPPLDDDIQDETVLIKGVRVRVLRQERTGDLNKKLPALLFLHGGGFWSGSVYMFDGLMNRLVKDTGSVVFMVDYRLSWENPAPGPLEECYRAAWGIYKNATSWGIDRSKIIVAGDSAGGNLAAALSLRLRDEETRLQPAGQVLIYPWVQALDLSLPSYWENDVYFINRENVALSTVLLANVSREQMQNVINSRHVSAWAREWHEEYVSRDLLPRHVMLETHKAEKSILPEAADKHLEAAVTNPYNFPLMHDDLWDLPPAFILTEEYDVLRDEGMMYARRLNQSGNVVVHVHDRPGWHGMFNFMAPPFNYRHAHRMTDEIVRFINSINNVF